MKTGYRSTPVFREDHEDRDAGRSEVVRVRGDPEASALLRLRFAEQTTDADWLLIPMHESDEVRFLFVYGTLRRRDRHPLHDLLTGHGAFAGEARVRGRLYDLGAYPGMVADDGASTVIGELYEITRERAQVLAALDLYEGCAAADPQPHEYRRDAVIAGRDAECIRAWAYVLTREPVAVPRIESGDYESIAGRSRRW